MHFWFNLCRNSKIYDSVFIFHHLICLFFFSIREFVHNATRVPSVDLLQLPDFPGSSSQENSEMGMQNMWTETVDQKGGNCIFVLVIIINIFIEKSKIA